MIELLNIDCMEYMSTVPDKYFDLAIVDPPYGLGEINFTSCDKKKYVEKEWNNAIPSPEYFTELYRISNHQIIWGCNYYGGNIKSVGRIVHDKMIPSHGLQNFSDCDLASQSFDRTIKLFRFECRGNVQGGTINWKNNGVNGRIHPTQKPIQLYKWLLINYASPNFKIIDTHLGSGSSAIAAYDFDISEFVGCEIDKEYYEAAVKRFETHKMQLKLMI